MFEIKNNFLIIPENLNFTSITLIDENTLILSNLKQNINLSMTSQNRKVYRIHTTITRKQWKKLFSLQ